MELENIWGNFWEKFVPEFQRSAFAFLLAVEDLFAFLPEMIANQFLVPAA